MSSCEKQWKKFHVEELFDVMIGKSVDGNKIDKNSGSNPYITRKESNNGLEGFITHEAQNLCSVYPVITIGNETAQPFVQTYPFFTGTKVNILIPKRKMSKDALLFIAVSLRQHKSKYNYSFTVNSTRLKKQIILLPIDDDDQPDYDFMEESIRQLRSAKRSLYKKYAQTVVNNLQYIEVPGLSEVEWKEFYLTDIFPIIQRGKRLTKVNQIVGDKPYVSSTALNNGVDNFISNNGNIRLFSNCLSIANSGSVGVSFYHPYEFVASDHVTHLKNENMSMYVYLFIATLTNRLSEKYNFNREINDKRISREKIMLPVDKHGEPDFRYMEQYIQNLMVKKLKQYLKREFD